MNITQVLRIVIFFVVLTQVVNAQTVEIPNTNAGKLLKSFFDVVETGNITVFVTNTFGANMLKEVSKEEHIQFLNMVRRMHGGFTIYKIEESQENKIVVVGKSKKRNSWRKFWLETDPSAPNKITGMEIDQTTASAEYLASLSKLKIKRPANDNAIIKGDIAKRVDAHMTTIEAIGYSGALLIAKNNEVILAKGYGYANREKEKIFDRNTVFTIGSITKQFTGAAIVKLESMGKISFDDPITKYFKNVPEDKNSITIHQMLTHSAGFPGAIGDDYEKISRKDFVDRAMKTKLRFKPGEKYSYSNVGYSLLGAIIEIVSGQSYEAFLRQHLFLPADMKLTGYILPEWEKENIVTGYRGENKWGKPTERLWGDDGPGWHLKCNGGILTTIDDIYKWGKAILGSQVFTEAEKKKYLTAYIPEGPNAQSHYAYGWVRMKSSRGTDIITHNGGNPYIQNDMYIYPDDNVIMYITSNNGDFSGIDQSGKILDLIFEGK